MTQFCTSQVWQPPFFEDPQIEGITFDYAEIPSASGQYIEMDEELEVPITIAKITYKGTSIPMLEGFTYGSNLELNVDLQKIGDDWCVVVNNFQDYETITSDIYRFHIKIDDVTALVHLVINNLFDEEPIITYNGPCIMDVS